ncbi:MAG: ATP-binding protein [bacterium]
MTPPDPAQDDLLRLAADMSPSGILAVDPQGRILLVNREIERMFGWTREELVGKPIETLLPMRFRHGHVAPRDGFAAAPAQRPMGTGRDLRAIDRDGREFPVDVGLRPVQTSSGSVTLASVTDASARLERERAERQSQKHQAIGTFANGIAHDFNNLLSGILGHVELAMRRMGDTENHDLREVVTAVDRGSHLVKQILRFGRHEELKREPCDLGSVVREVLTLLRASLPASIDIQHPVLSVGTPIVMADPIELHQVIMNLAANAAHAMPNGGRLEIRVDAFDPDAAWRASHSGFPAGRLARIVVHDTGVGMTPEVIERAFEPYFTTKPLSEGTGLGLSVVHGIVRELRGLIEVQSVVGQGTTFTIVLPPSTVTPPASPEHEPGMVGEYRRSTTAAPEPTSWVPRPNGARLLFVEDDPQLGPMQRRQLASLGYQVTLHLDPIMALDDFRNRPDAFDLLITDNTMPRMNGLQLVERIRGIRGDLPILMVSGLADVIEDAEMARLGIQGTLCKPHGLDQLDAAIREALVER